MIKGSKLKDMKPRKMNLIGKIVQVIASNNKTLIGVEGKVVDETKQTIVIDAQEKTKKVLKKDVKLKVGSIIIDGADLIGRPEERIKKKSKVKPRW